MKPTQRQGFLAAIPLLLYVIALLTEWLWPWSPTFSVWNRFSCPWAHVGISVVFLVGALWGIVKRVPLWSYSWIMFAVLDMGGLAGGIIRGYVAHLGGRPSPFTTGVPLLLAFVVVAPLLGWRGVRFGIFAVLLVLLHSALPFGISTESHWVSNSFVILAIVETAVAVLAVLRFLQTSGNTQRRWLYPLAGIAFIDGIRSGWIMALYTPSNPLVAAISAVATRWVISGVSLLVVWGLSKVMIRLTRRDTTSRGLEA